MSKSKFKVGDVVTLKSGGPQLIIYDLNGNEPGWVKCTWFNVIGNFYSHDSFHQATLELFQPEK